jgi:hypothetical protein
VKQYLNVIFKYNNEEKIVDDFDQEGVDIFTLNLVGAEVKKKFEKH